MTDSRPPMDARPDPLPDERALRAPDAPRPDAGEPSALRRVLRAAVAAPVAVLPGAMLVVLLLAAGLHVHPEVAAYPRVLVYDVLSRAGYRTAIISSEKTIRWIGGASGEVGSVDARRRAAVFRDLQRDPDERLSRSFNAY